MTGPRRTSTSRSSAAPRARTRTQEIEAAWAPPVPRPDEWTPRPWVPVAERAAAGRLARQNAPRTTHGVLELAKGRDPVAIILAQEADRLQDLLPLRHGRMAASAF